MATTNVVTGVGSKARFAIDDLSNTATTVFTAGRWVTGVTVSGGAAAEIVIFRATADTPEYRRVPVGIAGFATFEFPWFAEGGLEVLTASAAGDVGVTIDYL